MDDVTASDSDIAASRAAVIKPRRPRQTFADMSRSLGLMAIIIAVFLLIGPARTLVFPDSARRAAVDYSDALHKFQQVSRDALVPSVVPSEWRANAASFTPAQRKTAPRLHIGWATPGQLFVGLDETVGPAAKLEHDVLGRRGDAVRGTVVISGLTWQHRVSSRGEDAYTTTVGAVTAVVTGNGTPTQLRDLLTALSRSAG